jgi:hypothetical protein
MRGGFTEREAPSLEDRTIVSVGERFGIGTIFASSPCNKLRAIPESVQAKSGSEEELISTNQTPGDQACQLPST